MASDVNKHFEKARRLLEKNKLREAATEYLAVLDDVPSNQEAIQALADIYTRLNEPALAAQFYGTQFDRLVDTGDASKATAIFTRFLRTFPQPPDRLMQFGTLLQKQNRTGEAIEQFGAAAQLYQQQARDIEALACYESIALLDPENPGRHVILGELAERLGHRDLATRSYLRAGQLTQASGGLDEAIEYFDRAHQLSPDDRTGALLFAEARLRKGDAEGPVELLEPIAANEKDTAFLALFGEALLRTNRLDRSREIFEAYYKQKPEGFSKLFELAGAYLLNGNEAKAATLLVQTKDLMRSHRRETELVAHMDQMAALYPLSLPIAEVVAHLYEELNRETKYFAALVRLFDLYLDAGQIKPACDSLDRLVDIDPYDYRNHERISRLEGKADPVFLQNILARAAKAATVSTRTDGFTGAGTDQGTGAIPVTEEARAQQALEDLSVQVEIFLQYSLQSKAVERLQRIAELFPGEEEKNERLRSLYDRANWWPKGAPPKPAPTPAPTAPPQSPPPNPAPPAPTPLVIHMPSPPSHPPAAVNPSAPAETHRDLAAIAEINRLMYRQSTPREVLTSTATENGKHLGVSRCLVTIGGSAESHLTAEYAAPGFQTAGAQRINALADIISKMSPDALGGVELNSSTSPPLRDLGLPSALGVILTDKETQLPAGALIVGSSQARRWKPNESFFLQAVGDQLVLSVNH